MIAVQNIIRQSAYRGFGLARSNGFSGRTTTAFRSLATTPRSAATRDPDVNEDNILPVGYDMRCCDMLY